MWVFNQVTTLILSLTIGINPVSISSCDWYLLFLILLSQQFFTIVTVGLSDPIDLHSPDSNQCEKRIKINQGPCSCMHVVNCEISRGKAAQREIKGVVCPRHLFKSAPKLSGVVTWCTVPQCHSLKFGRMAPPNLSGVMLN